MKKIISIKEISINKNYKKTIYSFGRINFLNITIRIELYHYYIFENLWQIQFKL